MSLSLYEKILKIYPDLTDEDFRMDMNGYIILKDDGDGVIYIYKWTHPTYPKPTQQQLDEIV